MWKIECVKMQQNGKTFYQCKIPLRELARENRLRVDKYEASGNTQGYQRNLSGRGKGFKTFIQAERGVSMLPVLLATREKPKFKAIQGSLGHLEFPDDAILFEVDGQHRNDGYESLFLDSPEEWGDFDVPATIMPSAEHDPKNPRLAEAIQFIVINKMAKGVPADLVETQVAALFRENRGQVIGLPHKLIKDWEAVPVAIPAMIALNQGPGPWMGRIRLPNERGIKGTKLVAQKSFTDSLSAILQHANFQGIDDEELAAYLNTYWEAILQVIPEARRNPSDYALMKTAGVFVMHRLFPEVMAYADDGDGNVSVEQLVKVLKLPSMVADFWHNNGEAGRGSSQKAFKLIQDRLRGELRSTHDEPVRKRAFKVR
jgi:DGQHR domain-containing protein